jgi:endonuclease/exonuclease/phosphatase family metal-dependent hydrolase
MTDRSQRRGRIADDGSITIVTFNVLMDLVRHPAVPPWEQRRDACVDVLRDAPADAIALQETSPAQLAFIGASLPEFEVWTHAARIPAKFLAELRIRYGQGLPADLVEVALLTRRETLRVEETNHWWLSPTPDVELSTGFGKRVPRLAMSVRAIHLPSGLRLTLATTHIDSSAPLRMTEVCLRRLSGDVDSGRAVILFGDLNSHTDARGYWLMREHGWHDAYAARDASAGEPEIPTWIGGGGYPPSRIDHVLYSSERLVAADWRVLSSPAPDVRLSDHFPVQVRFALA